jgi:hypothetical protein
MDDRVVPWLGWSAEPTRSGDERLGQGSTYMILFERARMESGRGTRGSRDEGFPDVAPWVDETGRRLPGCDTNIRKT